MLDLKYLQIKNREELPYLLKYLGLNGQGIEIGVQQGIYSQCILERSDLKLLYLCDPWRQLDNGWEPASNISDKLWQADLKTTIKQLSSYENRYTILRKTSLEAVNDFTDESLDFVYLDADHRYEYVKEDLAKWFPKVKTGGIFAGHDYHDGNPDLPKEYYGVKQAVNEFFGQRQFFVTKDKWPSWYLIK
ncbi:MAG: hypothetical protein A3B89_03670 [Candidatus Buchananbacteria bacterium RIFCSPHIGHO2_02_FULL_40_13]|uniref:Methyltransferase n=1 Tax=Candidatus Buchananbacteria bacterium RIFCSPLOWO2_01_FULL_39_33 TaxID=1797543 RepID=A0A1G1YJ16_9BACT|nr:MAG: hypothetical protein A2820_01695 [Candidatus Buchananbacteria bacterium RIFCSPHIGHO2_01_FULL_40_35]OGY50302.1 MAG: hypothetical protein A3B89_03670 [Candidatus Buchananbacteria bacterium RIFCSPHIGHO2_02_FULL_40_13]OGY52335.1 MAG: hypothetical protein A3A02_04705 [Candidatus Buchananbacteria bacterium RIFCSPLOWO2_01_FULL_39_33]